MSDTVSWVVQLRIDIFFKEVWDFSVFGSILIWNKQKNYNNLTLFFWFTILVSDILAKWVKAQKLSHTISW